MCLHAEEKQGRKKQLFWARRTRSAPASRLQGRDGRLLRLIKSTEFLCWVGFSGLQDESRQLVLVRACPEIISPLWFTLAAGLILGFALIWVLRPACLIKTAPDAAPSVSPLTPSASSPSPGQRRLSRRKLLFVLRVCGSNRANIVLLGTLFFPL